MYSILNPQKVQITPRKVWPREITVDGVTYAVKPFATFSYKDELDLEFHELYEKMAGTETRIKAVFYTTDCDSGEDGPMIKSILFVPLDEGEKVNWGIE